MGRELRPLDEGSSAQFEDVVRRAGDEARRCLCTAAYTPCWEEPTLARPCRDRILAEGRSDGFLLYEHGAPVGWCQAAPRETMPRYLERSRSVDPDPRIFAVTCLLLVPEARGRGLGHDLLRLVLDALGERGVPRVHAFACRYRDDEDTSGGIEFPESLCRSAGMALLEDHPMRPLYGLGLRDGGGGPR